MLLYTCECFFQAEEVVTMSNKAIENPGGIPDQLSSKLHWVNSSNVLCNYMKKQEYLELILKNKAIIPRYVMEPLKYLGVTEPSYICFPMTCFCDIPFSRVNTHMTNYGLYGIALDKEAVIRKYKVQPIQYINPDSPLAHDFHEVFNRYCKNNNKLPLETRPLLNYVLSTLIYMKPISGFQRDLDGNEYQYIFQDECEWRYIPLEFPKDLHFILRQSETTEKGRDIYSEALTRHPETWIKLEWGDVRYIIVPDEVAAKKTIEIIKELSLEESEKYMLISKIEVSKRFSEDM